MSPSDIKKILKNISIRSGEQDNKKLSEVLPILFQLVERLNQENEKLKTENQKLRDEINLLNQNRSNENMRS